MSSSRPTYSTPSGIYINPSASQSSKTLNPRPAASTIQTFHASLPKFAPTPLISLPNLSSSLPAVLLKTESSRLGLPAFKILGASWGAYRALCQQLAIDPDPKTTTLDDLRSRIAAYETRHGVQFVLFAATEGNHGRAVARMAGLVLGEARARIFVPKGMYETTIELIRGEGADIIVVDGDYDRAVLTCWEEASGKTNGLKGDVGAEVRGVMVQDNAFGYVDQNGKEGMYEEVPGWIVEGYSTLLAEVDEQFGKMNVGGTKRITHVVTPIGVGSLGDAVVRWAKAKEPMVKVIACEPTRAGCLHESLKKGQSITIEAHDTIMSGMCCGTVSPTSWETLQAGVDASVTVGEWDAHQSVLELRDLDLDCGPCGAGCVAGLKLVDADEQARQALNLDADSIVVVLSTEGTRQYPVPDRGT